MIEANCPRLINSFVPRTERVVAGNNDDDNDDNKLVLTVLMDADYLEVRVDIRGY
jgi:hypothetical protein